MRIPFLSADSPGWRSSAILLTLVGLLAFQTVVQLSATQPPPTAMRDGNPGRFLKLTAAAYSRFRIDDKAGTARHRLPGEEHHNPYHIEAALKVLNQLWLMASNPPLGWRCSAGRPTGTRRLCRDRSANYERVLGTGALKQNWRGAFEDYRHLSDVCSRTTLVRRRIEPTQALIRRVVTIRA